MIAHVYDFVARMTAKYSSLELRAYLKRDEEKDEKKILKIFIYKFQIIIK